MNLKFNIDSRPSPFWGISEKKKNIEKHVHKFPLNSTLNYCRSPEKYTQMYYRKQNLLKIQPHWQFNFIGFCRAIQQGKLWNMTGKDLLGNKQINSRNTVQTHTLTHWWQDLWNICPSRRNTAELQLLINSLGFSLSLRHKPLFDRIFWWSLG